MVNQRGIVAGGNYTESKERSIMFKSNKNSADLEEGEQREKLQDIIIV